MLLLLLLSLLLFLWRLLLSSRRLLGQLTVRFWSAAPKARGFGREHELPAAAHPVAGPSRRPRPTTTATATATAAATAIATATAPIAGVEADL